MFTGALWCRSVGLCRMPSFAVEAESSGGVLDHQRRFGPFGSSLEGGCHVPVVVMTD